MVDNEKPNSPVQGLASRLYSLARHSGSVPSCILDRTIQRNKCYGCQIDDVNVCRLVADPDFCSLLLWEREQYYLIQARRRLCIETIKLIHVAHKIDLSISVLANIVFDKSPDLFSSTHSIAHFIMNNTDVFSVQNGIVMIQGYDETRYTSDYIESEDEEDDISIVDEDTML